MSLKDAIYPHTRETSLLCHEIAEQFAGDSIQAVISPAVGGVIISQWVAYHLTKITGREVLGTYAEREESFVMESSGQDIHIPLPDGTFDRENEEDEIILSRGDSLVVKKPRFVIRRGYDKLIADKNVLVAEDLLTTGGSVRGVVTAGRAVGANVIGVGVLCNRGGVTRANLGDVPKLFALVNVKMDSWTEEECARVGPCSKRVPINTDVGHGRAFLARKG